MHTCFNNKKCKNDGGPKTAMIFACFRTVHPTIYGSEKKEALKSSPGGSAKKRQEEEEKYKVTFSLACNKGTLQGKKDVWVGCPRKKRRKFH